MPKITKKKYNFVSSILAYYLRVKIKNKISTYFLFNFLTRFLKLKL